MTVQIQCSDCGAKLRVPDSAAGKSVKCPKCGAPVGRPRHNRGYLFVL